MKWTSFFAAVAQLGSFAGRRFAGLFTGMWQIFTDINT
jgi:hypothetical protein